MWTAIKGFLRVWWHVTLVGLVAILALFFGAAHYVGTYATASGEDVKTALTQIGLKIEADNAKTRTENATNSGTSTAAIVAAIQASRRGLVTTAPVVDTAPFVAALSPLSGAIQAQAEATKEQSRLATENAKLQTEAINGLKEQIKLLINKPAVPAYLPPPPLGAGSGSGSSAPASKKSAATATPEPEEEKPMAPEFEEWMSSNSGTMPAEKVKAAHEVQSTRANEDMLRKQKRFAADNNDQDKDDRELALHTPGYIISGKDADGNQLPLSNWVITGDYVTLRFAHSVCKVDANARIKTSRGTCPRYVKPVVDLGQDPAKADFITWKVSDCLWDPEEGPNAEKLINLCVGLEGFQHWAAALNHPEKVPDENGDGDYIGTQRPCPAALEAEWDRLMKGHHHKGCPHQKQK